jgi:hypothetical protein
LTKKAARNHSLLAKNATCNQTRFGGREQQVAEAKDADAEGVRLVAVGATRPAGEFALSKDEVTIGSAPNNDVIIEDATVSRRHARLTLVAARDEYQITDLGSTNGTYVNGRRVLGAAPIRKGDEMRIGAARFTLLGGAHGAPPKGEQPGAPAEVIAHT